MHAYLVLLRMEVAAFHPAAPRPGWPGRAARRCRAGADRNPPSPQTRLCGPVPRLRAPCLRTGRSPDGR